MLKRVHAHHDLSVFLILSNPDRLLGGLYLGVLHRLKLASLHARLVVASLLRGQLEAPVRGGLIGIKVNHVSCIGMKLMTLLRRMHRSTILRLGKMIGYGILPFTYKDFNSVPDDRKEAFWQEIKNNILDVPDGYKPKFMIHIRELWKKKWSKLKAKYFDPEATVEVNMTLKPPELDPYSWRFLVAYWLTPEAKMEAECNAANIKRFKLGPRLGRKSIVEVREEFDGQNRQMQALVEQLEAQKAENESLKAKVASQEEKILSQGEKISSQGDKLASQGEKLSRLEEMMTQILAHDSQRTPASDTPIGVHISSHASAHSQDISSLDNNNSRSEDQFCQW